MKRFRILAVILSFAVLLTTLSGCGPQSITFNDANLEAAVREVINKPEGSLYPSDLEPIFRLNAIEVGISDLTGLEYCPNMQILRLWDNNISDISALAGFFDLKVLRLDENNISDISPLAGLINLEDLDLVGNNISDISALAGLTNLQYLYLVGNNISDISALAGLTNLNMLSLVDNNISDISPLVENSGLSDGATVSLSGNPLSTTSIDVYIPQLEERGVDVTY